MIISIAVSFKNGAIWTGSSTGYKHELTQIETIRAFDAVSRIAQ